MVAIKRLKRKTKIIASVVLVLATLGTVTYKLADRYLIEHVEVRVASAQTSSNVSNLSAGSTAGTTPDASTNGSAAASSSTSTTGSASDSTTASTGSVQSDDWNYESDNEKISIQKVQKGSGDDLITYYVADVILKNGTSIQTAFAKDAFGTNITQNTSTIAANHGAVFAINGDYYGFRNDGVVIRNGTLYRDEPAREGLALLSDGSMKSYDEEEETSASLLADGVTNTFSFGPTLVQNGVAVDNFDNVKIDTNFGNRTIDGANPRTGIGMIAPNHYVFVVVDGRSSDSRGMTLNEFADLFAELGATEAYNLDGGGSSTMYFNGKVVNNPQGKEKERGVSDIIFLPE
ncbi:phosphodiester glycosidase family protein [Cohnella hashimotonis]|uniref:Phosphodiester glycosidase family protein n=1 Tax=Cohnella hashimotonis TaxID=2826895 RepID=A0ABT6TCJ5_9BACL|nr:phosphodiester glycosidase family protein [Cohnella hashimotonis]